jgi:hypothetical protein
MLRASPMGQSQEHQESAVSSHQGSDGVFAIFSDDVIPVKCFPWPSPQRRIQTSVELFTRRAVASLA